MRNNAPCYLFPAVRVPAGNREVKCVDCVGLVGTVETVALPFKACRCGDCGVSIQPLPQCAVLGCLNEGTKGYYQHCLCDEHYEKTLANQEAGKVTRGPVVSAGHGNSLGWGGRDEGRTD